MKIYTKRGDTGETDLFGGGRVSKCHQRVKAFGDIDGANSALGLAFSTPNLAAEFRPILRRLMGLLFCAGAEVSAAPKKNAPELLKKWLKNQIDDEHILILEQEIDEMEARLTPLKNFILPCGSDLSARLQFARTMVRKAEISLVELLQSGEMVRPEILRFFNRLSDYLFVMARVANAKESVEDIVWSGKIDDDS